MSIRSAGLRGLMLGLIVPGMIETIQEKGLAGWWTLLFSLE